MAISRSYPRHLVKFRENESFYLLLLKKTQLFYNSHFFIVLILFSSKKTHFLFIHIISFILWIIHPNIRPDICPDICPDIRPDICPNIRLDIRLPGYLLSYPPRYLPSYPPDYPFRYLMLPNLTNQFNKLNSDFFLGYDKHRRVKSRWNALLLLLTCLPGSIY